jgi:hypothetical protein
MSVPEPSAPQQPELERAPAPAPTAWPWPVAWMIVTLLLVGGAVYVFHSCRSLPRETLEQTVGVARQVGQGLQKLAAAFRQGTITTTFTSYATSISGSQYFQFATLSQEEVFTRKDEASLAFGYIPLPDIIVQATAPVTYTYYLDLNARWDFVLQHGVVWVTAPDIKFNKPAVDASRITYEVKKNSVIRNTTEAVGNLKNSITWMSYQKARANIDLVRETGRKQTEAFVQNWLARTFADGKNYPVKVRFRHEPHSDSNPPPTIPDPSVK